MRIGYHNRNVNGFEHTQIVLTVAQADRLDGSLMVDPKELKELSYGLSFIHVAAQVQESSPSGESQTQPMSIFCELGHIEGSVQDPEGKIELPLERKLSLVLGEARDFSQSGWGHLSEALDLQVVLTSQLGKRFLKLGIGRSMGDGQKATDFACLKRNGGEVILGNEDPPSILYDKGILVLDGQAERDDLSGCLAGRENERNMLFLELSQGREGRRIVVAAVVQKCPVQVSDEDPKHERMAL
jgi:hypothetical protein